MTAPVLDPDLLSLLQRIDTPTVCNAIETAQGRRGFEAFTRGTPVATAPEAGAVVGYARTATIQGARPPGEPPEVIRARRLDYFRHMAAGPRPAVAVIEDIDHPGCVGAWWGEVHVAIHKGLGLAGALTNGLVRDLGSLAEGFPVIAGAVGVSHGFVHVVEIGAPVTVMGLTLHDGDLVHADRHGAVVIPADVVAGLAAAIARLEAAEAIVLTPAASADFDIDILLEAWSRFEAART
ncbi:MAG: RraA family protein [Pseudomonadota bacterium]